MLQLTQRCSTSLPKICRPTPSLHSSRCLSSFGTAARIPTATKRASSHTATTTAWKLCPSLPRPNTIARTIQRRHFLQISDAATIFYISRRKLSTTSSQETDDILNKLFDEETRRNFEGNDVKKAMRALLRADAVCFDVDSTVIQEEGIDVLAESLGKGQIVADYTARAMTGDIKFEDALRARLDILKPSRNSIEECLIKYPLQLSPGVDTLIQSLHARGTDVYLVSGGFRIMIEPLARQLGVDPARNVFANTILFEADSVGSYRDFDPTEPTSADQGKPKALRKIKERGNYDTMVMVGDGATDAQAMPPADSFIGFGGVVVRDAVREKACWFVKDFEDMIAIVTSSKLSPKK